MPVQLPSVSPTPPAAVQLVPIYHVRPGHPVRPIGPVRPVLPPRVSRSEVRHEA